MKPSATSLQIINPATGRPVESVPTDDAASVRAKGRAAHEAQPRWAAVPLRQRLATIARFRAAIVTEIEELARAFL